MFSIRRGVFETNSSSTHSLTICTQEEFDKWGEGEFLFDTWEEKLIAVPPDARGRYETRDKYFDDEELYLFEDSFITPSGDEMVAFGKYGRDD